MEILLGGLGGFIVALGAKFAFDSRTTARRQPPDRTAQLETAVAAYRAEVAELQDRVERWFKRVEKRQDRDKAVAEISTGNPQPSEGAKVLPSATELRERALALIMRRRR